MPPKSAKAKLRVAEACDIDQVKSDVVTLLADRLEGQVLRQALVVAVSIHDEKAKARALSSLTEPLRRLPIDFIAMWVADSLPKMRRREALNWLAEIATALSDERAVLRIVDAIEDVCQRWR